MNDLHSFTTPPRRLSLRYEPSERLSERKRALFPTNDKDNTKENVIDSDDDLGHMSPLELSSSPDRYASPFSSPHISALFGSEHRPFSNKKKFSNLFEKVTHLKKIDLNSPDRSQTANSVIFAPGTPSPVGSPSNSTFTNLEIPETPTKVSPTQALKTPHESSSTNLQLPRLVRKSLADLSNIDKSSLKRKQDSPQSESPNSKNMKLDVSQSKISKARTSLFPESILPAKSFYPKSVEEYKPNRCVFSEPLYRTKKPMRRQAKMYLCSRKKVNKSMCGQINAGVRHGIRKPKHKPNQLTKTQILNAAIDILDNSPLNDYLSNIENKENLPSNVDDKKEKEENPSIPSTDQLNAMDSILKNISTDTFKAQPLTTLTQTIVMDKQTENKTQAVKRPLSPQVDSNKKFFKSSRAHATVTINKNIKLTVNNGEMHLIEKKQKKRRQNYSEITFDTSDLAVCEEEKMVDQSFNDILKSLDDDNNLFESIIPNNNSIILTAHNSVSASDNSIQLHNEPTKKPTTTSDMLLSPTTLMCDMTSGLALNSPKNQTVPEKPTQQTFKKCISFPDEMANASNTEKLFPIFYKNNNGDVHKSTVSENQKIQNLKKIWKPMSEDQMILDAGQKKFGHTQCPECNLVYQHHDPDDEKMHHEYHHSINILRFNGWKNERVVSRFEEGRVILVQPDDPKIWWKKIKELVAVINRDLGFVDVDLDNNHCKVYIYIRNKQIEGCVVTEPITNAYKMLPFSGVDQCTEESYPVKCGISRIWVPQQNRKKGIATLLLNAMRCNYMYGHVLKVNEIAFSAPTEAGRAFAVKYTGTEEFLIYTSR